MGVWKPVESLSYAAPDCSAWGGVDQGSIFKFRPTPFREHDVNCHELWDVEGLAAFIAGIKPSKLRDDNMREQKVTACSPARPSVILLQLTRLYGKPKYEER